MVGVAALALLLAQPALGRSGMDTVFVVPPELRPQVEFWKSIFATYSELQVVVHDTEHLDRVYSVLDFRSLAEQGEERGRLQRLVSEGASAEKERIRALLVRLHQADGRPDGLTREEARIARLFVADPSSYRFLDAASPDRIRSQTGLRERFASGIEIGHRYFPEMEAIFRAEGVPIELTRLPLIESCFNVRAYSKVGAAGIWQFMPATGRRFMRVDSLIDERRDPIVSTRAAARFLRENYERLGSWPLALKAYNHGPGGIARAVRELGTTDVVRVIQEYRGPAFRFASRNFYPEFLAALEVERNHERHFGRLVLQRPLATETVPLGQAISIRTAASLAGVDRDHLADLNPSLSPSVQAGNRPIPAGYRLRLPPESGDRFAVRYAEHARRSAESVRSAQSKKKRAQVTGRALGKKPARASSPRKSSGSVGKGKGKGRRGARHVDAHDFLSPHA
jgi:membrane-bound lytic murein transglycosylase D